MCGLNKLTRRACNSAELSMKFLQIVQSTDDTVREFVNRRPTCENNSQKSNIPVTINHGGMSNMTWLRECSIPWPSSMTSVRKVGNAMIAAVVAMDSIGAGRFRKGWCLAPVSGAQGLGEAPVESMKLQVGALNGAGHPAVVSRNFLS